MLTVAPAVGTEGSTRFKKKIVQKLFQKLCIQFLASFPEGNSRIAILTRIRVF